MLRFAKRLLPSLAAAGILITIGGCADIPTSPADVALDAQFTPVATSLSSVVPSVAALIGPQGGVIETGGHRLVFPAGALVRPTMISMKPMDGMAGAEFGPHGLVFPAGAQPVLTLSYAGAAIPSDAELHVAYLSASGGIEEVFETAHHVATMTVSATIPHFSGYLISSGRSAP
jgi:hypothetical protein